MGNLTGNLDIPDEILYEKNYSTIILYVLGVYGTQRPNIFYLRNKLMNINTFYAHVKKLKGKNFVSVTKKARISEYDITSEGRTELNRRLKDYKRLDFKSIVSLEQERIGNFIDSLLIFFRKYEINYDQIKIEYLQLANEITRDKIQTFEQSEFDRLLLFLTFNHPRFFPDYSISKSEFIDFINKNSEEEITLTDLNYFLQLVCDKEIYGIKFYKLILESKNQVLYFRSNGECGIYFETSIKAHLKRNYYLKNLMKRDMTVTERELETLKQNVLGTLINSNLFNSILEQPLKLLIGEYIRSLDKKIRGSPILSVHDVQIDLIPFIMAYELSNISEDKYDVSKVILEPFFGSKMEIFQSKMFQNDFFDQENIEYLTKIVTSLSKKEFTDFINKYKNRFSPLEKLILDEISEFFMGYYGNSLQISKKITKQFPKKYVGYLLQILNFRFLEKYDEALKLLLKARNMFQDNSFFDIQYSLVLTELGRSNEAMTFLDKKIAEFPEKTSYFHGKSVCLLKLKNRVEALKIIELAISIHPNKFSLLMTKGEILQKLRRLPESNKILDYALQFAETPLQRTSNLLSQAKNYLLLDNYGKFIAFVDVATNYNPSEVYDPLNPKHKWVKNAFKEWLEDLLFMNS